LLSPRIPSPGLVALIALTILALQVLGPYRLIAHGRLFFSQRRGAADAELRYAAWHVGIGMFLSNVVMYFIVLASAATLHATGRSDVRTAADVADALRPLAGDFAAPLLGAATVGLVVSRGA
jgi:Mn2+/Fe2+ NRAMP family transporter